MARHAASPSLKDRAVDLAYGIPSAPLIFWLWLDMRTQRMVRYFKTRTIKEIAIDVIMGLIFLALVLWTPIWLYVSYVIYF